MSHCFVVEIEAEGPSASFLLGYLQNGGIPLRRVVSINTVRTGSIQDIIDEAHAGRRQIGGAA